MSAAASVDDDSELEAVKGVEKGGGGGVSVVVVVVVAAAVVVVAWRSGEETVLKFREDCKDRWARKKGEGWGWGCGRGGIARSALVVARRWRQRVQIIGREMEVVVEGG